MIELHIVTKKTEQVKVILELLIKRGLIVGATVIETKSIHQSDNGKICTVASELIMGKTNAVMFNVIEKLLTEKYGADIPEIYGMPVVGMDRKHRERLQRVINGNEQEHNVFNNIAMEELSFN